MVVLDTSAAVEYLVRRDAGEWVEQRLALSTVHGPHVLDVEVLGVLRRLVRLGGLPARRAREALDDLAQLRVERYSHVPLLGRMWELRNSVTPRDAAFVALAEMLGATLVTVDRALARAPGIRTQVVTP